MWCFQVRGGYRGPHRHQQEHQHQNRHSHAAVAVVVGIVVVGGVVVLTAARSDKKHRRDAAHGTLQTVLNFVLQLVGREAMPSSRPAGPTAGCQPLLHNQVILHSRTAYQDHPDQGAALGALYPSERLSSLALKTCPCRR
jgi:hypothetical protein